MLMDAVLQAIAEPNRRQIMRLVQDAELSAGEIAWHFPLTRPAVSQHLQVLVSAGLVTMRREGTRRLYRSRPEGLAELRDYLEGFWTDRLRDLKEVAETEERSQQDAKSRRIQRDRSRGPRQG